MQSPLKRPPWVSLKKNFQNKASEMAGNTILTSTFANAVDTSYRFFQQLQKHYIALNSQKLIVKIVENVDEV